MSEPQQQEEVQRIQKRFGVNREQASLLYQESLRLSQQQIQRSMQATSNFITTVVALLSSAVGFVAALAWNDAISAWLPTVNFLSTNDKILAKFYYAIVATIFAVVVIGILGFINGRIKGRNLIPPQSS